MMTFAIFIELPNTIKQELLRVCFGLPSADWHTEESLYIILRTFNKLTDTERWDILDRLAEIEASPFSLKINRLNFSPKRGNTGLLWAALETSIELETLKKRIDSQLRTFNHQKHENNHTPYSIMLGTLKKEAPERIAQYFEANGEFASSLFEVNEFVWGQLHQTEKHQYYTVEKRFTLV